MQMHSTILHAHEFIPLVQTCTGLDRLWAPYCLLDSTVTAGTAVLFLHLDSRSQLGIVNSWKHPSFLDRIRRYTAHMISTKCTYKRINTGFHAHGEGEHGWLAHTEEEKTCRSKGIQTTYKESKKREWAKQKETRRNSTNDQRNGKQDETACDTTPFNCTEEQCKHICAFLPFKQCTQTMHPNDA
eukprot:m.151185 g.151185  ORF g.151185 m.151185 type:complete len:185 (-) comp14245_c1_seq2:23-577(-)